MYDNPGSPKEHPKTIKFSRNNSKNNSFYLNHDLEPLNHSLNDNLQILQPHMRYKARSDLERIWDSVNKTNLGRANKEIIENQFKIFDSNNKKKNKIEDEKKDDEFIDNKRHLNRNQIEPEKKSKTREQIKKEMNVEAKNILSELHVKTHFKGATSFANSMSIFSLYKKLF
jgi:hypothetical protein